MSNESVVVIEDFIVAYRRNKIENEEQWEFI